MFKKRATKTANKRIKQDNYEQDVADPISSPISKRRAPVAPVPRANKLSVEQLQQQYEPKSQLNLFGPGEPEPSSDVEIEDEWEESILNRINIKVERAFPTMESVKRKMQAKLDSLE